MKIRARRAHTRGGADSVPPFRDFFSPAESDFHLRITEL